jgi:hypothetical protein
VTAGLLSAILEHSRRGLKSCGRRVSFDVVSQYLAETLGGESGGGLPQVVFARYEPLRKAQPYMSLCAGYWSMMQRGVRDGKLGWNGL